MYGHGIGYGAGYAATGTAFAAAGTVGSWWGIGAVVVGILILIALVAIFVTCL